jgi:hypothetical protein
MNCGLDTFELGGEARSSRRKRGRPGSDTREKFDNFHIVIDHRKWLAGRPPLKRRFCRDWVLPVWSFRGDTSAMNGHRSSPPISKTSKPVLKQSNRVFRLTMVTCVAAWFLVTRPLRSPNRRRRLHLSLGLEQRFGDPTQERTWSLAP